jgi:hypothetical protein
VIAAIALPTICEAANMSSRPLDDDIPPPMIYLFNSAVQCISRNRFSFRFQFQLSFQDIKTSLPGEDVGWGKDWCGESLGGSEKRGF